MKGDLWGLFLFTDAYGQSHEGLMRTHEAGDRGLMERICPCGIGHPDPDHMAHVLRTRGAEAVAAEGIHGCCGHCDPDYTEEETE